jgi:ferric iron reductase protein FhuF
MFQWGWKDFEEWWQKYGPETNVEENASFVSVIRYYEGVGVLVKKGLIDLNLVGELMSSHVIRFWEKLEPVFKEIRERLNWPEVFQEFEYLYNEIITIVEEQHPELKT